jgi:hypothetical protein
MTDGDFLREEPPAYGGGGKPSPLHEYQRIIWALMETRRLMGEIDASIKEHGGWPLK